MPGSRAGLPDLAGPLGFARRGVASGLYRRIETTLSTRGTTVITTHASLAARPFFDHHGFQLDVECRGPPPAGS